MVQASVASSTLPGEINEYINMHIDVISAPPTEESSGRLEGYFIRDEQVPYTTYSEPKVEDAESEGRLWEYGEPQYASSIGMPQEKSKVALSERPPFPHILDTLTPDALAHATGELPKILEIIDAITLTKATQCHVPIESRSVSTFTDVDEGWTELVYEINVNVGALQALAFWDSVGAAIDRWKSYVSEQKARLLTEKLAIHVNWR